MSIFKIISELAAISSRNEKESILKKESSNKLLQEVFKAAYDPTINYYVKKIPEYAAGKSLPPLILKDALKCLDDLSQRKVTGNAAFHTLGWILQNCSIEDAKVIELIIKRDLRCGVTETTINKIWKNLIPEYPYMRCSLPKHVKMEKLPWKSGMYSQLKADGMFANVNHLLDGEVQITSRNGSEFPLDAFQNLIADVKNSIPIDSQVHGELLIYQDGQILPRQIGNGILNSILKGGSLPNNCEIHYEAWDLVPLAYIKTKGEYTIDYSTRFDRLEDRVANCSYIHIIETKIVYSMKEALEHYREMISKGFEGTIIKSPNAVWKDGTSKEQIKMKLEVDVDLEIIGFNPGNGKNEQYFGSIQCASSDKKLIVNVSGFTDDMRKWIHEHRNELMNTIITVKSNNLMEPSGNSNVYSMFLPRFVELRKDKTEADDLQKIIDQFESAIK